MLHDIIQQYGNWPNLWKNEPWHKYDIGILPSDQWVSNRNQCSQFYYARPKHGVYKVGWPKADALIGVDREKFRKEFNIKHGLDSKKKTILYAPAWENDNKEDDFIKSCMNLNVNILIKQYPATPENFPEQYREIMKMFELHKDLEGVCILDSKTNILF